MCTVLNAQISLVGRTCLLHVVCLFLPGQGKQQASVSQSASVTSVILACLLKLAEVGRVK